MVLASYFLISAASMTMQSGSETSKATSSPLPSQDEPRLLFAGEATHEKFWSFMHGARESGIREANRILKEIKSCSL